ncbi:MAG: 6-bladed beta-propeller [Dysgonamonadaceae bacterium]|jgi:hypothetical protein|nr:6-bladed beta-propeller [Dysgonamonadaceae bacterium]
MKHYCIYSSVFLILISCRQKSDSIELYCPTIQVNIENVSTLKMEDIATLHSIIPLHTSDDLLIGNIGKVVFSDSSIIVWDSQMKSVLLFDVQGKYKYNIGTKGNGPNEYTGVYDMYVNPETNRIYLLDEPARRIFEYDMDGRILNVQQSSYYLYTILPVKDGCYGVNSCQNENKYDLIFLDSTLKHIKTGYFPFKVRLPLCLSNNFTENEKQELFYHYSYSDTIYKMENNKPVPFIAIDFGNKKNPVQNMNTESFKKQIESGEYVGRINNVYVYNEKIFFSFSDFHGFGKPSIPYHCMVTADVNNIQSIVYNRIAPPKEVPVDHSSEILGLSSGKLIYQIIPGILPEKVLNLLKNAGFENLESDSNPVLIVYKLK